MYYQINRETQKMELVFSREEYMALPTESKNAIKSNFLFSKSIGGWVSRAKFPHLHRAEEVAKSIGAENRGKINDSLSFEEQMQRKAERAEEKAERMETHAYNALKRGEELQKPIKDMHGDISFFTQPNINTSSGRAFTNRRKKMFDAYDRGFEEFKKSEYYAERAETARRTASMTKPTDKGFCERRIADAQKTIKAQRKNIETYEEHIKRFDEDENYIYRGFGKNYSREDVENWIENAEEIIEQAISKEIYYRQCLDELGGIQFNKDNIKVGYIVKLRKHGLNKVVGTGPKFFTYVDASGNFPCELKASYGEILEVVKAEEESKQVHPFKEGEEFHVDIWHDSTRRVEKTLCKIVKVSEKTVTVLDTITGKKSVRTPKIRKGYKDSQWAFFMDDNYNSGYFKPVV